MDTATAETKLYATALSEFQAQLLTEVQTAGKLTLADVMRLIADAHKRMAAKKAQELKN